MNTNKNSAAIEFHAHLGSALLIAESENGAYEPVTMVGTINEAIELAAANFRRRMDELDRA